MSVITGGMPYGIPPVLFQQARSGNTPVERPAKEGKMARKKYSAEQLDKEEIEPVKKITEPKLEDEPDPKELLVKIEKEINK
jgi:hypothetical protein